MQAGAPPRLRLLDLLKSEPKPTTPVANSICLEQQFVLVSQGTIFALATIFIVTVSALVYALNNPAWIVLLWYTPIVIYAVFQLISSRRALAKPAPEHTTGRLMRMAEQGCIFLGLMYGATYFLFYSDNTTANFFIIGIVSGFCSSLTGLMSSYPRQVSRFIVCAGVPMAVSMAVIDLGWTHHTPSHDIYQWVFLLPILAGLIGFFRCVMQNYDRMARSVIAREKAQSAELLLRNALNASNDAFAIFDRQGTRLMSNSQHEEVFGDVVVGGQVLPDGECQINANWFSRSTRQMAGGFTVVSHTNITELKIRERELVAAQKEAVEADKSKTRFLSTMSHELRSPLNAILGFSRLMASDSKVLLSKPEVGELADSIQDSGTHLLSIVDDIIDYTQMGLNKMILHSDICDARSLIGKSIKMAVTFGGQFNVSNMSVEVSRNIRSLQIDEAVTQRILINLVSNAMRFSGGNSKLSIKLGLTPEGEPFFAIRDFGPGIKDEHLERVFEAFYQIDAKQNRNHAGTGLGLTLCRHLARLQGGDVLLRSRVGVGTTAILKLPASSYIEAPETLDLPQRSSEFAA